MENTRINGGLTKNGKDGFIKVKRIEWKRTNDLGHG
jgi:hypothetical protein